jgi:hypothetical protein
VEFQKNTDQQLNLSNLSGVETVENVEDVEALKGRDDREGAIQTYPLAYVPDFLDLNLRKPEHKVLPDSLHSCPRRSVRD